MSLISIPQVPLVVNFPGTVPDKDSQTSVAFSDFCDVFLPWMARENPEQFAAMGAGFNAAIVAFNTMTAGLTQQEPIAEYVPGTTYAFPTCVAGSNGHTYRYINDTPSSGNDPVTDSTEVYWHDLTLLAIDDTATTSTVRGWSANKLTTTLAGKQATLIGTGVGQNIRKVNGNNLLGSTDITVQATLASGTNIKGVKVGTTAETKSLIDTPGTALEVAALKGTSSVYGGAKFSLSGTTLTITTT